LRLEPKRRSGIARPNPAEIVAVAVEHQVEPGARPQLEQFHRLPEALGHHQQSGHQHR
jgi:hypothetical protein